ncbi:MAG: TAXI family TRAP transporter solute-binding subunit [Alphaproteobacteria bacterium]|nr:TAXI family TRAP transporter solute-binding subunit [Alphaproteobacteria bacterium]
MRKLLIGILGAAVLAVAPAHAQTYNLTLAGASPGGLWSRIGLGLDKAMAKAYPGSTVTYQTGSGGIANAKLVQDKKVPMGIATDPELASAVRGTGPFRGKPQKDLRVLVRVYAPAARFQLTHLLMNADVAKKLNINSMADFVKNASKLRVAVNRPGNMDGDVSLAFFKTNGLNPKKFRKLVRAASREMTKLILDRRIDALSVGLSFNHRRIREMAKGIPLLMLNQGKGAANRVAKQFGLERCKVLSKEYKFLHIDSHSVCFGAVIMANKSMSNKTAYDVTKAMLTQIEAFKSAHRALKKATTPKSIAQPSTAAHHPGAIKAYKEAGLM